MIKNVATGELVPLSSLWTNRTIVLAFLRRWGWQMCRAWALDLSSIKAKLDGQDVALVAVGLEEIGVKTFVDGKYFDGELYIDQNLATYKSLGMKRIGMFSVAGQLISKQSRKWLAHANQLGVTGDMKGNGLQQGGTYVIEKGGKVLFKHTQEGFGDHPKLEDILKSLNISAGGDTASTSAASPKVVCDDNACSIEK